MTSISKIISARYSCRSFTGTPVDKETLDALADRVASPQRGPFGNMPRFSLLSMDSVSRDEWRRLGTYGVIKNARLYLAGMIRPAPQAALDFGYCMEKLILEATRLSLETCWLGGTFSLGAFASAAGLRDGEEMPCVSPVGYAADSKSLTDRLFRRVAGSDTRKPWRELFFTGEGASALSPVEAGPYAEALENVRLAPSASNKQPWRIVRHEDRQAFTFYLSPAFGYRRIKKIALQEIDLGIAMSHFDLTVKELGLQGTWLRENDARVIQSWDYIATWQAAD